MAAWTVTITDRVDIGGNRTQFFGTLAATGTYTTGGDSVDSSTDERFARLLAQGGGTTATGMGYVFNFNAASQLLVVLWGNAGTASVLPEFTSGGDLTALTAVPFIAYSD